MEDTTGEDVSRANRDVSSDVDVSTLSREELCRGLYTSDGFIFLMALATGLYGKISNFETLPQYLTTEANSRFDTTKFFLAKVSFRDLKTATSYGWKARIM